MNKECKAGHVNLVSFEREWNTDNCFETLGILITAFLKSNTIHIEVRNDRKSWGENGLSPVGHKLQTNWAEANGKDAVYTQGVTSTKTEVQHHINKHRTVPTIFYDNVDLITTDVCCRWNPTSVCLPGIWNQIELFVYPPIWKINMRVIKEL